MRIMIVGGSAAGLSVALLLARDGNQVTVLDHDRLEPAADVETAAKEAARPRAPHLVHTHVVMCLAKRLLVERLPGVHAELLRTGAVESPVSDRMPPTLADRSARPGDDELAAVQTRRSTFDWVLRSVAVEQPEIRLLGRSPATGLLLRDGDPLRVVGVRTTRHGDLRADVVVDAGGRRSPLERWLVAAGAREPERVTSDCGIVYYTRHYRLRAGAPRPGPGRLSAVAPLQSLVLAAFTADNDVLSCTLCPLTEDRPLRALRYPRVFDAVLGTLPGMRQWLDVADPISDVHAMGRLRNTLRRAVTGGRPVVHGLHTIGDALCTTNPTRGRGLSVALQGAVDLAAVLWRHPDDPRDQAEALHALTEAHVEPWFVEQVTVDSARLVAMRRALAGRPPEPLPPVEERVSPVQLQVAAMVDPVLFRALMATIGMIRPPREVCDDPEVRARTSAVLSSGPELPPGPSRADVLAALDAAGT